MSAPMSSPEDESGSEDLHRARAVARAWRRELPDVPTRSIALVWLVKAVGRALRQERAQVLDRLCIDAATLDLLSTLRRSGPPYRLTTRELAERCLVSAGAISQRVARAEGEGLALRSPGPGRSVQVLLTDAGHALVERSAAHVLEADDLVTASLSTADVERLERVLSGWLTAMRSDAVGSTRPDQG